MLATHSASYRAKPTENCAIKQSETRTTYSVQSCRLVADARYRSFVNFKRSGKACSVLARVQKAVLGEMVGTHVQHFRRSFGYISIKYESNPLYP